MTTPPPSRKLSTSNNTYNGLNSQVIAASLNYKMNDTNYAVNDGSTSKNGSSNPLTPSSITNNLDENLMNDLNMQRSLSHESNLRCKVNQFFSPPSPSHPHQNTQQISKYLTANNANTATSKSNNTSSNNLNKNNKLYKNSDEANSDHHSFNEINAKNKNPSYERIHENIEYYNYNENNYNSNNENFTNPNNAYNYSKNSIENIRRLSTEGSDHSSKCPSGIDFFD